ncbi:MAG: phosphoribosylglycinamide formyltransferase [Gemmatimonadota bacterium]
MKLRAAVFASGRGSNFQALLDHASASAQSLWEVVLLVVDRPGAGALNLAPGRGIPGIVIMPSEDPATFPDRILTQLEGVRTDFVLLAGYLRLMPRAVVERFRGKMLNLHPALLPGFGGKGMYGARVHQAVLASGTRISGATIHFVDEEYDRGRILAQWPVPVLSDDTPDSLYARIQEVEHVLYPAAVDLLARSIVDGVEPSAIPTIGRHFHLSDQRPTPK